MHTQIRIAAGAVGVALLLVAVLAWRSHALAGLAEPYDRHNNDYAGSSSCLACHQDRHASWYRTWHRTMTQKASAKSVLGRFDGEIVEYWGVPVRPVERDGRYYFEYLDAGRTRVIGSAEVTHTVGSHRYQQYLAREPETGGNEYRLQLLWHNEDARWVHLNGAFLHDDQQGFSDHVAIWNQNCIFCHNTGPQPRIVNYEDIVDRVSRAQPVNFATDFRFDSTVAELGIACESCHGPGAEHGRRNRDPMRRYLLRASGAGDPTIVNPATLEPRRSAEVCGQCHAQRVPARVELAEDWLHTGPTYRPGDRLGDHVRVVTAEEPGPAGNPDLYRKRFWPDGMPRLSAYEYQGLQRSKCFEAGALSCMNCHDAHGGDPNGMMRTDGRTNAPCLACHQELAGDPTSHTRHPPDSSGSLCVNCHMPPAVYGVMDIHRSHQIEVPRPLENARDERPGACTGCHLDRSAGWAAAAIDRWGGSGDSPAGESAYSEHFRQLLGGDPVQRAIAAELAGRSDGALSADQRLQLVPALLIALEDRYPAVRRFAQKSIEAIARGAQADELAQAAANLDFIARADVRVGGVQQIVARWQELVDARKLAIAPPDPAWVKALAEQAARRSADINIGE